MGLGVVFVIAGIGISVKLVKEEIRNFVQNQIDKENSDWSTDPAFTMKINLNRLDDAGTQEQEIASSILASFKRRGVNPPQGEQWHIEVIVESGFSPTQKLSLPVEGGKPILGAAPMLTCRLIVNDASNAVIYDNQRIAVMPKDALQKNFEKEDNPVKFIREQMWKLATPEFAALAAEVPHKKPDAGATGGTTPATDAKPANGSEIPAK
jgi:hypothetical protein